jgi:GNAT superfamily N-acetyltransferase
MSLSNLLNKSGFFLQNNDTTLITLKGEIIKSIEVNENLSRYDQYAHYFYKDEFSVKKYFISRLEKLIFAVSGDWIFFYELTPFGPYLIGTRLSKWDEDHFKFKMAQLQIFTTPDEPLSGTKLKNLLEKAIDYLKINGVSFVSSRMNGDHIVALHALEDNGFRFYDNVIWPISRAVEYKEKVTVRLMKSNEVDKVKWLAENFQYQRGHYYCDDRFDKQVVNSMYPKWIDTALKNNESIAVIEYNNDVAGFFEFKIDEELFKYTGYKYGRLRLLALNSAYRGKGLGEYLFKGTLSLIKNMGADYVDSGYSTKNHVSAKLHAKASFYSVYEEVTFHLWL